MNIFEAPLPIKVFTENHKEWIKSKDVDGKADKQKLIDKDKKEAEHKRAAKHKRLEVKPKRAAKQKILEV